MRTTQAARYARWSAMVALLLVAAVASSYFRRAWQEREARKTAPSSMPAAVQQQSAEFTYSKVDGDRTEFTVRASHATQFAGGDRSVLEDVWLTVYGKDGLRSDNLHTRSCEYLESSGSILCAGAVQMDLQSAEDAKLFPGTASRPNSAAHILHISTSNVTFDRKTGTTSTDQPVNFRFPQGQGRAVGMRYESQQGELQLLHSVDMMFQQAQAPGDHTPSAPPAAATAASGASLAAPQAVPAQAAAAPPALAPATPNASPATTSVVIAPVDDQTLHVCGSSLLYRRDERIIHLQGPVQAQQGSRELDSGQLAVELDTELRAHRIVATDQPKMHDTLNAAAMSIAADELSALLSPEGWTDHLVAVGNVHALTHGADRDDRIDAGHADLKMTARTNHPQQLVATQNVVAESVGPKGLRRTLNTSMLTMDFAADGSGGQSRLSRATTPEAKLDWQSPEDAATKSPAQRMDLASQHLDATFGAASELRDVHGTGGVQVERQIGNGPVAVSTSREMVARTRDGGDWTSVDQTGDVHLRQMDRAAQSDLSHFDRLTDTAVLSGSVVLTDSQSRVTAQTVTFHQLANEFHADGHVVSSEASAQNGGATNLAPGPARISADRLVANTMTGLATYSGQARLWQGDSLVQADTITLDRDTHVLTAINHVRAVFPQAAWQPTSAPATGQPLAKPAQSTAHAATDAKPEFWRAEANRMTYSSDQSRGRLEQNVYTHSSEGAIRADAVDLFFASTGAGTLPSTLAGAPANTSGTKGTVAIPVPGPQQLTRATALGHVIVEQEDRRGTSTQADYTASEGKFVLSGGPPIVYDASGNSTTGRQLTLFFSDDRIVVDSAEGLRTLTLHRVGK